jgi:hypothetical protein
VLTTGAVTPFAICTACERRGGPSLAAGWLRVMGWIAMPILVLFAVVLGLYWVFGG